MKRVDIFLKVTVFSVMIAVLMMSQLAITVSAQSADAVTGYEASVKGAGGLSGSGTKNNPYRIYNEEEWSYFCRECYNMSDGLYYSLEADIETEAYAQGRFCGHFNGNGHTITVNYSTGQLANMAPFVYVVNSTFENLRVAGTIKAININSAGGLIGKCYGATITNCTVSVDIQSVNGSKAGEHGGLVASLIGDSKLTIKNCVFDGSFSGAVTSRCGGFVGNAGGTVNIIDSLYAPKKVDFDKIYTFAGGTSYTLTNTYWVGLSKGSYYDQGTRLYADVQEDRQYKAILCADGNTYYHQGEAVVTGVSKYYEMSGTSLELPTISVSLHGETLTPGTDYTVSVKNSAGQVVNTITEKGFYSVKVDLTGNYVGSTSLSFGVTGVLSGSGTSSSPYVIKNDSDWVTFARQVSCGNSFNGKYIRLDGNIRVDEMAGNSTNVFSGTFLGNNKTITVELISQEDDCALFCYVDGAKIEKLNITGSISTSAKFGAGIAAHSLNDTSITDCKCSVTIVGSGNDDGTHGGFVALNGDNGSLMFTRCSFKGNFTGSAYKNGGFVGWNSNSGSITYTDCLFAPSGLATSSGCSTYNRNGRNTFVRAYYVTAYGTAEGTKVTTTAPSGIYPIIKPAGESTTYYGAACSISGINETYGLCPEPVCPEPVVKDGSTVLTKNTDYTVTWTETAAAEGSYTLTVKGKGSYGGTKTLSYEVRGDAETLGGYTFTQAEDDQGVYYIIANEADLRGLSSCYLNGTDAVGKRFVQTADIDLSPGGLFKPIGSGETSFKSIYDGGNHKIYGLDVNVSEAAGLIGNASSNITTVKNVWLIAPKTHGRYGNNGGLVGSSFGVITNCVLVEPTIVSEYGNCIGTIVGRKLSGTVTDCYYYKSNQNNAVGEGSPGNNVSEVYRVTLGSGLDVITTYEGDGMDSNGFRISSGDYAGYYCKEGTTVRLKAAAGSGQELSKAVYNDGSDHTITASGGVASFTMPGKDVAARTSTTTALNYSVVFNSNGGSGTMSNMSFSGTASKALSTNRFTRAGYVFDGWNTVSAPSEDNPGRAFYDGETVSCLTTTQNGKVTLYAQWKIIPAGEVVITKHPGNLDLIIGETDGNILSVEAAAANDGDYVLSYQWYYNSTGSNESGTLMTGSTKKELAVSTQTIGTKYYYCVVTASRSDNNEKAKTTSAAARVKIGPKGDAQVSIDAGSSMRVRYGSPDIELKGTVSDAGKGEGRWTWKSSAADIASVTSDGSAATVSIKKTSGDTPVTITASYSSVTTEGQAEFSLSVIEGELTLTGLTASDKEYDGSVSANLTGQAALEGVKAGDSVSVNCGTAYFTDKNVGTNKTVNLNGFSLEGADIDNYELIVPELRADITAKPVTVTVSAVDRDYDPDSLTVSLNGGIVRGVCGDDVVTVDVSGATGIMADADVGDDKTVNVTGVKLGGEDAGNYALSGQPIGTKVNITRAEPLVSIESGYDAYEKTYGDDDFYITGISTIPADAELNYEVYESRNVVGVETDNDRVISVSANGRVSIAGAGSAKVAVYTPESANYRISASREITVVVNKGADPAVVTDTAYDVHGGVAIDLSENVSGAMGAVSYAIDSDDAGGCSVDETSGEFVSGDNNGTCTVKVTIGDSDNYSGREETITVTVGDKGVGTLSVSQKGTTYGSVLPDPEYMISGTEDALSGGTCSYNGVLRNGTVFGPSTEKPTDAGRYTLYITYETDTMIYTGTSGEFVIGPKDIEGAVVTLGDQLVYNGAEQEQSVAGVEIGEVQLDTSEYTVSGNKAKNAGEYTLSVKAAGTSNYTGTKTAAFTIEKLPVEIAAALVGNLEYTSTGAAIEPELSVYLAGSDMMITASDYTVSYSDNIDPGTGKITVSETAGGNFTFVSVTVEFEIKEAVSGKDSEKDSEKNPETDPGAASGNKVPPTHEQDEYASSEDNLAPVSDSNKVNDLVLDLSKVASSGVAPSGLCMTVVKGTKLTTSARLKDKTSAKAEGGIKVKVNKKTLQARITCKKDGKVSLTMEDGNTYTINIRVQSPKAQKAAKTISIGGSPVTKTIKELFGTDIDAGKLTVQKQKYSQAGVSDNMLIVDPKEKDSIRIQYQYLNKKYRMTVKVK